MPDLRAPYFARLRVATQGRERELMLGFGSRKGATLTVCGDQAQHIDPAACFLGWEHALGELGIGDTAPVQLRTSYRCTEAVTRLAHEVLGSLAPPEMPQAVRGGPEVLRSLCASEAHASYDLVRALTDLTRREPVVTVAVVTRTPETAHRLHQVIDRSLPARLVLRGEFSFTPGIDVVPVSQVKGLEFDVVIIPDATPASYGDDSDSRRKLHVAITRAIEQVWILSVGPATRILPRT